jgi:hypothetical protein
MKPLLACDIDGVIAECMGPLLHTLRQRGFECDYHEVTSYEWPLTFLEGKVEQPASYLANIWWDEAFLRNQPVILPMLRALTQLRGMVNQLYMLTARDPLCHPHVPAVTRLWLDEYGVPYDKVIFQPHKAEYCRTKGIKYIIEDSPATAEACHALGIGVFLIDHPYNRDVRARGGLWRVHHPSEIPRLLEEDLARV